MTMWTHENTEGFTDQELATMNEAQSRLEAAHPEVDPGNLADRLNSAFVPGITADQLVEAARIS